MAAVKKQGSVEWRDGCWKARISYPDGTRPWVPMPGIPQTDEERARSMAVLMQCRAKAGPFVPEARGETVNEWSVRYFKAKKATTLKDIKGRFNNWILPVIGHLPMAALDRLALEAVVRKLDEAIVIRNRWYEEHDPDEERKGRKPGLEWKTAANIWGDLGTALEEAFNSKDPGLRALASNPSRDVRGPERGNVRAQPVLFPAEFLALVSCEIVPVRWRRCYAGAFYLGARSNELAAILPEDVDTTYRTVSIHKQIDRATGKAKTTKTRQARVVAIEAELWPLVDHLVKITPAGKPLFRLPPDEDRAELLRKHLELAGVNRVDLFADDALRSPIRFHNARHTCLVWKARRGDDVLQLQATSGHTNLKTLQGYTEQARKLPPSFGAPFPSLPSSLYGLSESCPSVRKQAIFPTKIATPTGIEPVLPA